MIYTKDDAAEHLFGLLNGTCDKKTLAKALSVLVIKEVGRLNEGEGWNLRDIELSVINKKNGISISLGE